MIVCKFGGSSVADASQIKKVKAILDSDPRRTVAVVSAPGKRNKEDEKITDMLYKCNSLVQKGQSCKSVFMEIGKRFLSIAEELGLDKAAVSDKLDEIRYQLDGGRGADFAASRGEYLSAWLISQYLGWEFVDSADVIVINAEKAVFTGRKAEEKEYESVSGYPGGRKVVTAKEVLASNPVRVIEEAVWGMMPKGRLGRAQFRKLRVYAGAEHPHMAQQPRKLTLE